MYAIRSYYAEHRAELLHQLDPAVRHLQLGHPVGDRVEGVPHSAEDAEQALHLGFQALLPRDPVGSCPPCASLLRDCEAQPGNRGQPEADGAKDEARRERSYNFV